jgi:thiol:disulfide interchange protein
MIKAFKATILFFFLFGLPFAGFSQIEKHSSWNNSLSKEEVKAGGEVELIFQAKIDKSWYMYSSDFDPDLGPTVTTFTFKPSKEFQLVGKIQPVGAKKKFDELWGGEIKYFTGQAEFRQKIKVLGPVSKIEGTIEYQECSDIDGKCIPHEEDFSISGLRVISTGSLGTPVEKTPSSTNTQASVSDTANKSGSTVVPSTATNAVPPSNSSITLNNDVAAFNKKVIATSPETGDAIDTSLIGFVIGAFLAGLLALLTPCVYPMIPMTVTYFSTRSYSRKIATIKAVVYGLSIIFIYTVLGLLVSLIFGPDALNAASTHWITNVIFFTIFVIFALSFFGLFEINMPSSLVNKVDAQSDKGGYYGVFFMAFTIVLVSFSCTGPIVASILLAASQGEVFKPAIGMFGFSLAFALPFGFFALFPKLIQGLPKSGGWLNAVKVVLGFIELALAFKFLSVADQVYHWGLLDRDVFIVIWIAIFSLMGLYLIGKFKLPHDSDVPFLSIPRMLFALLTFGFVIYLIPGLFGAPLKSLSGLIPPMSTHDFNIVKLLKEDEEVQLVDNKCEEPIYNNLLEIPHGIRGYFQLEQALRCGAAEGKPVFIDFTGHGCTNCREMEANVWSDPSVLSRLKEKFVVVALYIDERTELNKEEIYTSGYDNKVKNTIGKRNFDIEKKYFYSNAQPYYCIVDHQGKLLTQPKGYDLDVKNFTNFLDNALKEFEARKGLVQ